MAHTILLDDTILGNASLHSKFCQTAELLAVLISYAPNSVDAKILANATGQTQKDLAANCSTLWQAMLISPDPTGTAWRLVQPEYRLTLEDVFRCIVDAQNSTAGSNKHSQKPKTVPSPEVELFISQATMAINQAVFQHLRQFSLNRLQPKNTYKKYASPQFLHGKGYDEEKHDVDTIVPNFISPLS